MLGATGPAGRGLAARLATVGHHVIVGSRDRARAEGVVAELREQWGERVAGLAAGDNSDAAAATDLVILATTWEGIVNTAATHAEALGDRIVVSMANGLERVGDEFRPVLPPEGSLAAAVQAAAPRSRVVAAFQHVPAAAFAKLEEPLASDVVVCGDDAGARRVVVELIAGIPDLRGFDGGSLANAVGLEAFAAVLLSVNIRHSGKGTLRLVGVEGKFVSGT